MPILIVSVCFVLGILLENFVARILFATLESLPVCPQMLIKPGTYNNQLKFHLIPTAQLIWLVLL